jgi:hypothetical protein
MRRSLAKAAGASTFAADTDGASGVSAQALTASAMMETTESGWKMDGDKSRHGDLSKPEVRRDNSSASVSSLPVGVGASIASNSRV